VGVLEEYLGYLSVNVRMKTDIKLLQLRFIFGNVTYVLSTVDKPSLRQDFVVKSLSLGQLRLDSARFAADWLR
jgi:hypothetical protein